MALTEAENEEALFSAWTSLSSSDQAFPVTQSKQGHSKLTNDFLRGRFGRKSNPCPACCLERRRPAETRGSSAGHGPEPAAAGGSGAGDRMGRTRAVASRRARQAVWAAVPCPRMERSQWERPGPCPGPRDSRAGRPWGPSGCPHARPPCCGEAAHRERVCPQAAATALGGRVKTGRPSGARWGRAEAPARPRCPPWASAVPPVQLQGFMHFSARCFILQMF